MKYVSGKESLICINTSVDFKGFVGKICFHLKINWSQSNVHIFITGDASWDLLRFKTMMMETRSFHGLTKLYVIESPIKGRDN